MFPYFTFVVSWFLTCQIYISSTFKYLRRIIYNDIPIKSDPKSSSTKCEFDGSKTDPYDILNIQKPEKHLRLLTTEERNELRALVQKQYRRLSLSYHPDKNQSENTTEIFVTITNAKDSILREIDLSEKEEETQESDDIESDISEETHEQYEEENLYDSDSDQFIHKKGKRWTKREGKFRKKQEKFRRQKYETFIETVMVEHSDCLIGKGWYYRSREPEIRKMALQLKLSSQDDDTQYKNHDVHKIKNMKKKRNKSRREFNNMRKAMLDHDHSDEYFMDYATTIVYAAVVVEELYLYISPHPLAAAIRLCNENIPTNTKIVYQIIFQCLRGKWESPIDDFGHSALHYAVFYNHPNIVEFLLQVSGIHYDVLLLVKNKAHRTALDMAQPHMSFYRRLLDLHDHAKAKQKKIQIDKIKTRINYICMILLILCFPIVLLTLSAWCGLYTKLNLLVTIIIGTILGLIVIDPFGFS